MHLTDEMHPEFLKFQILVFFFSVTLFEAIDTAGFLLKTHIAGIKRMVFGINLAAIDTITGIHSAAGFKLGTITHDYRNFFVLWVDSVFHWSVNFFNGLFQVGKDKALKIYLQ